jgi:hypothetical protein
MLMSSGNFCFYTEESSIFNVLAPRFGSLRSLENRKKLTNAWLKTVFFKRSGLESNQIQKRVLADCRNPGDFLRIVMEEIASTQKVERWAEATNEHLLYIPQIKKTIPDALIVHIIRDGRDVALSMQKLGWLRNYPWSSAYDLETTGLYWGWLVHKGRYNGALLGPDYFEVRYEELVTRPRETLAHLGTFIEHDLNYDRIRESGVGPVVTPNTSFRKEIEGSDFSPIGRWKRAISADQLADLEAWIGRYLEEMGYSLATAPEHRRASLDIRRKRMLYPRIFDLKQWLKANTPIMRLRGGIPAKFMD